MRYVDVQELEKIIERIERLRKSTFDLEAKGKLEYAKLRLESLLKDNK